MVEQNRQVSIVFWKSLEVMEQEVRLNGQNHSDSS